MFIDPSGNIATEWDKAHLTDRELYLLRQYTMEWEAAKKNNDPVGMKNAHDKAEAIRNAHRASYEYGSSSGYTLIDADELNQYKKDQEEKNSVQGVGISGAIGAGLVVQLSICYIWDNQGNNAIVLMPAWGAGVAISAGGTYLNFPTMNTIDDLINSSSGGNVSFSVGAGIVGAGGTVSTADSHTGGSVGGGVGKVGVEAYVTNGPIVVLIRWED